jgi:hypothetical protein
MLLLSITLVQDFQVDVSGEVIYCELVSSGIIRCKIDGDGFRSQVVLKYGLRSILQSVFHGLIDASANESASDTEIDLLRSLFHLLQELDVPDDLTLPQRSFTRQKLRRCFRNDVSFTRMHTPENKKRLRPSHIPPS